MDKVLNQPLTPLGEILLQREYITHAELNHALHLQTQYGGRIGATLLGEGFVSTYQLHQAIAEHYQLPFVNLESDPLDASLLSAEKLQDYITLSALPYIQEDGVIIIATSEPSHRLSTWAEAEWGTKWRYVITSPYDIRWQIEKHFAEALNHSSRLQLFDMAPDQSARNVTTRKQRYWMAGILSALTLLVWWQPYDAIITLLTTANIFYLLTIGLKIVLFRAGIRHQQANAFADSTYEEPIGIEWPVYTILIPLYREDKILPELIPAIRAIDYPKSKLDIKLIIEADDLLTINAAKALKPENIFEIIRVPFSLPRTKPKACNYALHFARGEYITIYDAEDKPDPLQLKKAIVAFRQLPDSVTCLQSRLNYHNLQATPLTRLFAIEYAAWFDFMLPGLERLGMPLPLGGTSNHIPLQKLRDMGGWDPFNVTEDADLGIRFASHGGHTSVLHSITLEEAPQTIVAWIKQRSRWIKGYMQTWLVHMRHPVRLYRQLGFKGFAGFQLFIGTPCLVFLVSPLLWLLALTWIMLPIREDTIWFYSLSVLTLISGLVAHLAFSLYVVKSHDWNHMRHMRLSAWLFPFYWLLHSLASIRALFQLIVKPHFWDKTSHGISDTAPASLARSMKDFLQKKTLK